MRYTMMACQKRIAFSMTIRWGTRLETRAVETDQLQKEQRRDGGDANGDRQGSHGAAEQAGA